MDKRGTYNRDQDDSKQEEKSKKNREEFKCGEPKCNKLYHSYTAFYNHCKKAHNGEFPAGSLLNGELFDGPTKNRGRPRIKKNEIKNEYQIQSMKAQNEFIQFLGTVKLSVNRGGEELISYVEDPAERVEQAFSIVKEWFEEEDANADKYLNSIVKINKIICDNDLPEFYDPIEFEQYLDRLDSYNFSSIYKFFKKNNEKLNLENVEPELLLICWLARLLSLKLLTEVIFTFAQRKLNRAIIEKDLLEDNSSKFLQLADNYLGLIEGENLQENGA